MAKPAPDDEKEDTGPPRPKDTPAGRRKAYAYVQERLAEGAGPERVRQEMIAAGYSREEAVALVARAEKAAMMGDVVGRGPAGRSSREARAEASLLQSSLQPSNSLGCVAYLAPILIMLVGAMLCAIGTVVTVISFQSASEGGPGLFMWGFIIGGGATFLGGAAQLFRAFTQE